MNRKTLIAVITFLSGLYFFLEWLLPEKIGTFEFGAYHEQISNGFVTVGAMAIGLGLINIVRVHGGAIIRGRKGSLNSVALLLGLLIMFVVEGGDFISSLGKVESWTRVAELEVFSQDIFKQRNVSQPRPSERLDAQLKLLSVLDQELNSKDSYVFKGGEGREVLGGKASANLEELRSSTLALQALYENGAKEAQLVTAHKDMEQVIAQTTVGLKELADANYAKHIFLRLKHLLENGFFFPLGAAMFSLLAFYIAVAAYRSFRIKSFESLVMMFFALMVMLGQIPQGPMLWDKLPTVRLWMMDNISTPAVRAIEFGAIIAGLAMAVRMWLSLERSPLAVDEEVE